MDPTIRYLRVITLESEMRTDPTKLVMPPLVYDGETKRFPSLRRILFQTVLARVQLWTPSDGAQGSGEHGTGKGSHSRSQRRRS